MANENESDDEEDSKDNILRRRAEEQTALRAYRLTREKDSQFSIDMGDGKEVKDRRPLQPGMNVTNTQPATNTNPETNATNIQSGVGDQTTALSGAPPASAQPAAQSGNKTSSEGTASPRLQQKPVKLTVYMQARLQLQTETFGVIVRPDGNMLEYIRNVNGREVTLFTKLATDKELVAAEEALKRIAADSQNLLSAKFGITFSYPDEVIIAPPGSPQASRSTIFGRQPSLLELDAASEALSVSDPAHLTRERTPMKISFLDSERKEGPPVVYVPHADGNSQLYIYPDASKLGHNNVHQVARFFVEALAYNTISKAGSIDTHASDLVRCISLFRGGPAERKQLLRENKTQYDRAKEIDQWEINREYGLQQDGLETKIRLPNGKLVHNKREMREEIERFEASAS